MVKDNRQTVHELLELIDHIKNNVKDYDIKFMVTVADLESAISVMFVVTEKDSDPIESGIDKIVFSDYKEISWDEFNKHLNFFEGDSLKQLSEMGESQISIAVGTILKRMELFFIEYSMSIGLIDEEVVVHIPSRIYSRDFLLENTAEPVDNCEYSEDFRIEIGEKLLDSLRKLLEDKSFAVYIIKDFE
ncbi:MAG: hypothetical protein GPJ54_03250 [Candidatus Heimdallarchaeota archaeon]|nr:hypothetical protein [Candidatus Heimdallarchaeota archaeon]